MAPNSLSARVVEVIADLGKASQTGRYRYGSGCIVNGRTVLTAAHVVAGATGISVRDPGKVEYNATLEAEFLGHVNGPGPDLALLEIVGTEKHLPPIGLARVDRDDPNSEAIECHAVGYPLFAETGMPMVRDTVDAIGVAPVLSKLATGLLSIQVSISPTYDQTNVTDSAWAGMSGGPVVADGLLIGVITEHSRREGQSTITAVPLTAIDFDTEHPSWGPGIENSAAWWSRLGVTGPQELAVLAGKIRKPPPYQDTMREFGRILHHRMPRLLGREQELGDIVTFANGVGGYRWMVGGAYAGKTALLYEAITTGAPKGVDVIYYFLSRRASDADSNRFLAAVVPQLAFLCGVDPPVADRDNYHSLWRHAVELAGERGRPILLVVDGLDEDVHPHGSPSVASLLPTLVGGGAHVLVASRPHPELPTDLPDGHPLTTTVPVHLEPFAGAESLIELARREINELTETADADLAMEVMGLLTAAAGPLSVQDLADLTSDVAVPLTGRRRQILHLLTRKTARSLESVGSGENQRYQFAHYSLLEYAQESQDLSDPEYRDRIHRWAEHWRHAGWPITADLRTNTPRYLLEGYPTSLAGDPDRLAALVGEVSWIDAVVRIIGVDHALAVLRTAAKGVQSDSVVTTMLDSVVRQARHLRSPRPIHQPGYVLRQLGLQAMELGDESVAEDARARLVAAKAPGLVPKWTTRRTNLSLVSDLGVHEGGVHGLGVLPDGRVVTGGGPARRMLLWDPTTPGSSPVEFTNILHLTVWEVDVLPDGRVVTAGLDGRMLLWDPARPDCDPVELGTHVDSGLGQLGVLPDGRVITSGFEARVLLWDPATPGADPIELGIHRGSGLGQLGVLSNGRVVTHGNDGRILLWDPATPGAEPVELAVHGTSSAAVVMLNDRRMVHTQPDGRVQVWNLASSGAEPEELKSHRGKVEVQPDGRVLLWDSTTPESAPVHLGIRRAGLGQVHVLADGRVVTGGISEPVLLWDPTKPGATPVELGGEDLQGYGVKSLSHGRLVTKSNHGQLRLCAPSRDGADPVDLGMCGGGSSFSAALLEDGRLVTGEQDGRIRIWDPTTPKLEETEMDAHGGTLRSVAGLPDGRVVTGGNNGKVLLWDPKTPGADPVELGAQNGAVLAVGAIRDGRVVTGGNCRKVLLWNPATPGADPVELGTQTRGVWHLDVMADGRFVTGGFEGEVLLWDPNTPEEEPVQLGVHGKRVVAVAALADGRVVSGGTDGRVLIWDPASPGHEPITLGNVGDLMEKSPDGKTDDHCESIVVLAALADGRVVSGGTDGTLLVWDLTTSDADPFELGIHTGRVVALAELTDGWVMSSTQDGPMVLWDPKSGERIAEIAASVEALSLSSSPGESADHLTVAHSGGGLSGWSIAWRTAD